MALLLTSFNKINNLKPDHFMGAPYAENFAMVTVASEKKEWSIADNDKIYIYPNTASGQVKITSSIHEISSTYMIEIFNLSGKKVKTLLAENKTMIIDVYELTAGMYTIKLSTDKYSLQQHLYIG